MKKYNVRVGLTAILSIITVLALLTLCSCGKDSSEGSYSEDDYTYSNYEAVEDYTDISDDIYSSDTEGTNGDSVYCAWCGTTHSDEWHETTLGGEKCFVCDSCHYDLQAFAKDATANKNVCFWCGTSISNEWHDVTLYGEPGVMCDDCFNGFAALDEWGSESE